MKPISYAIMKYYLIILVTGNLYSQEVSWPSYIKFSFCSDLYQDKVEKTDFKTTFLKTILPQLIKLRRVIEKKEYKTAINMLVESDIEYYRNSLRDKGYDVESDEKLFSIWIDFLQKGKKITDNEGLLKVFLYHEQAKKNDIVFNICPMYQREDNTVVYSTTISAMKYESKFHEKFGCAREFNFIVEKGKYGLKITHGGNGDICGTCGHP